MGYDAFVRPCKDFQVRTAFGGYLTICAIVVSIFLFCSEFMFFLELDNKDVMTIDNNQDRKIVNYKIDLTVPSIPCAALGVNILDTKKMNVLRIKQKIIKRRVGSDGTIIGMPIYDSLRPIVQNPDDMNRLEVWTDSAPIPEALQLHSTVRARCHSCHDAKDNEDDCCPSCDSLKKAYADKKIPFPTNFAFDQCIGEAFADEPVKENEGCRLTGDFAMRKLAVHILFGLNQDVPREFAGSSFIEKAWQGSMNWTHTINTITFGPDFPGFEPVLDGATRTRTDDKNTQLSGVDTDADVSLLRSEYFLYNVHIIPTLYVSADGKEVDSHQYSVTDFMKRINIFDARFAQPSAGIRFQIDFTPFQVAWLQTKKKLAHFLTNCCAIIGGIIAFSTFVDNMSYRFSKKMIREFGGNHLPAGSL